MDKTVIELFAGVGGFRVGLNKVTEINKDGRAVEKGPWDFVWANQWEPSTKAQDAFNCYEMRFGKDSISNEDITQVDKATIKDHTLLTGGFPCQDYSVARSLHNEKGIEGKKGVLWWQINDILIAKHPKFVLLENVDRLLKAPAKQRGQAFGIILRCFCQAGYGVQWRVINAADYGHPQRRRRVFIFAFHNSTKYFDDFKATLQNNDIENVIIEKSMFSSGFRCKKKSDSSVKEGSLDPDLYDSLVNVSSNFHFGFENSGFCLNYKFKTMGVETTFGGKHRTLMECLDENNVPEYCYKVNLEKFRYLKGAKHINRTAKNGHEYTYSEGPIPFPDFLDRAGRTMLTSEGTTNRSSHLIEDPVTENYRILTPVECERLDEFPDNWTNTGMSEKRRYFIAGNALVCGLIRTMGIAIAKIIDKED